MKESDCSNGGSSHEEVRAILGGAAATNTVEEAREVSGAWRERPAGEISGATQTSSVRIGTLDFGFDGEVRSEAARRLLGEGFDLLFQPGSLPGEDIDSFEGVLYNVEGHVQHPGIVPLYFVGRLVAQESELMENIRPRSGEDTQIHQVVDLFLQVLSLGILFFANGLDE